MHDLDAIEAVALARRVGLAWLAMMLVGILAAVLFGQDIDINLSADVEAVAVAMLDAETRLRALAYVGLLISHWICWSAWAFSCCSGRPVRCWPLGVWLPGSWPGC